MDLPIYELTISPDNNDQHEVNAVAFVDAPAIERDFMAFNAAEKNEALNFAIQNEEQREVFGAAMVPDMLIYRNDDIQGEYYVKFSKETIKQIAEKFFKKDYHKSVNIMHQQGQPVDGVVFFQSLIKDTAKVITIPGDHPDGTWFLGAKINNDQLWNEIKAGKYKGFSVEGLFTGKPEKMNAKQVYEAIQKIINGTKI